MTTSKDNSKQFMESPLVAWVSVRASRSMKRDGGRREGGKACRVCILKCESGDVLCISAFVKHVLFAI